MFREVAKMGFRFCSFEERMNMKEADMRLFEPLKQLVRVAQDRLEHAENIDEWGRKILYLEIKNASKQRLYALFNVPSDSVAHGLFVYRIECGEHELPLGLADCMLLPKSAEFITIKTCYRLRDILPQTILEVIEDLENGTTITITETRWNAFEDRVSNLSKEGYIKE